MPRKKRDNDQRGFKCPDCGIRLEVASTVPVGKGIVRRIRHCPICGYVERTEERSKGQLPAANGVH